MSNQNESFVAGRNVDPRDAPGRAVGIPETKIAGPNTVVPVRQMERVDPIVVKVETAHHGIVDTVEHRKIVTGEGIVLVGNEPSDSARSEYRWTVTMSGLGGSLFWLPGDVRQPADTGMMFSEAAGSAVILDGHSNVWIAAASSAVVIVSRVRFPQARG